MPHWVCQNFLPSVGQPQPQWASGRHRLDSSAAITLVWQRLVPALKGVTAAALTLPGYLSAHQALLVKTLGQNQRVPVIGSLPVSMAAALAAAAEQWWADTILVIDVDDHAAQLDLDPGPGWSCLHTRGKAYPAFGFACLERTAAQHPGRPLRAQSRRDPRDAPAAEQSLYEQLDSVMDSSMQGRFLHVAVQATQWYQNLLVHPEDTLHGCLSLAQQSVREIESLVMFDYGQAPPVLLLTAMAARLPGLVTLARQLGGGRV